MVPVSEIANNDYNLNIPRYIDSSEPEDLHDLDAHLRGGIPDRDLGVLESYWKVFPSLRADLFESNGRAGYSQARVESRQVKATILKHPEFGAYSKTVTGTFQSWRQVHEPMLKALKEGVKPKAVIAGLSEDLLVKFELPLLNKYDVYQRLMDYWAVTMQDDVFLVGSEGWLGATKPRAVVNSKERNIRETPDLTVDRTKYKMDLISPALIVAHYFSSEKSELEALQIKSESSQRELEDFIDENSGDEGFFDDPRNEKDKITKPGIKNLKNQGIVAEQSRELEQERAINRCLELIEADAAAAKAAKEAQAELDGKVLAQYAKLSEAEIKSLVVDHKWFVSISKGIDGEVQRLAHSLAGRVNELEERYAVPLPKIENAVDQVSAKVEAHLKQMGMVLA